MAEFENNQQTTTNSKSTTNNMTSSSLFNRSLTIHSTPVTKPYLQSTSGFFNSFESMKGKVKKLRSLFESPKPPKPNPNELQIQATKKLQSVKSMGPEYNRLPALGFINDSRIRLPGTEDRIVVYLTSLRGIRRTYEDCYAVRMIFRGCFIRGNHVGGAEVIKQMFETGEMARVLDGIPRRLAGFVCAGCGDVRFVPCGNCSGSRKLFDEDEGGA
ncbi:GLUTAREDOXIN DOMAIN-CONTAINING CYSTEINE-RICH PROTEIN CG12206-RELATED [Salix viminalis]|uniref:GLUTAREDOXIN DOMAIN-CONTAINING CYSTEINE-RICH PROTEIN CG12206-RELATED n=1 Tax=Salix viminalis TaxID=40686 RepID=A0A9Q0QAI5_SALVM|nr:GLUTAREDOXIN DOMAIN-CONTAINING CYSTEINE-RICH PROTEIN CG12206-RELATED [Salix viminalis]